MQGRGLRHVLQRQVVLQRGAVHTAGALGAAEQLEQRLLLGAERDRAVGEPGGEQRLDPERVARAERRPGLGVPDDEREHAAQPVDDVLAPQVVAGDDRLGVALGRERRRPRRRARLAQLQVVVDLAVEDDPVAAVGVGHRLVAVLDVDERQPVEAEHGPAVPPGLVLVGAAVAHAVLGLAHRARRWSRRPGRRRWRSRRAGHTSGAGPRGRGGVGCGERRRAITRVRRRGSSGSPSARRRRTGTAPCRRARSAPSP